MGLEFARLRNFTLIDMHETMIHPSELTLNIHNATTCNLCFDARPNRPSITSYNEYVAMASDVEIEHTLSGNRSMQFIFHLQNGGILKVQVGHMQHAYDTINDVLCPLESVNIVDDDTSIDLDGLL